MSRADAKIQDSTRPAIRPWIAGVSTTLATALTLLLVPGPGDAMAGFATALLSAAPKALMWLASAAGLGRLLAAPLRVQGLGTQMAIGAATLLAATQWAGTFGLFRLGTLGGLIMLAPGWWMLARHLLPTMSIRGPAWISALLGVSLAPMLVASMVPTGFIWSTEFGGYDALSYHLQVPKEWALAGAMRPLPHVAYSALPDFVEGAYAHLMLLRADPREAALACQLLHALLAVVAAWSLADATRAWGGSGGMAALALLATPWITVTGSLAYSESGVLLGMALAMSAARAQGAWRAGILFGLAAATLVGSKPSSVVLALPAALLAQTAEPFRWKDLRWWITWISLALVALFPWMLRNALATGSPLFPMMAATLGHGWWSPEQATRWDMAHRTGESLSGRALAIWRQFLTFGVGANPQPGEPWRWLWGPLPWLGIAALAVPSLDAAARRATRSLALMVAIVLIGWAACTHLQSRFLLPSAAPLAMAIGMAWSSLERSGAWRVSALACSAWALLPAWTLVQDSPRALEVVGRIDRASGDLDVRLLRSPDRREAELVMAEPMVEAALGTLFEGERVLGVGWSTPFWLPPGTNLRWSTVWDTNPIESALQQPDPLAWLRERFDLVILDERMLERWRRSGWLAPGIDMDRLAEALRTCPQMKLLGGCRLVGLRSTLRPRWPARSPDAEDAPY